MESAPILIDSFWSTANFTIDVCVSATRQILVGFFETGLAHGHVLWFALEGPFIPLEYIDL